MNTSSIFAENHSSSKQTIYKQVNKCCDNNNGASYVSYVKRVSLLSELLNKNWELADAKSGSPLAQNAWKKNCRYVTRIQYTSVYIVHKTNRIEKYHVASRFPTLLATLHDRKTHYMQHGWTCKWWFTIKE